MVNKLPVNEILVEVAEQYGFALSGDAGLCAWVVCFDGRVGGGVAFSVFGAAKVYN